MEEMITIADLRGDLHVHTAKEVCETHLGMVIEEFDEACGCMPLGEVVDAARDIGMEFVGITNHTSNPVDASRDTVRADAYLAQQHAAVADLRAHRSDITIFSGAEVNILPDGTLDVSETALGMLDYAIVSMHLLADRAAQDIQAHYIQAVQHRRIKIIGHANRYISTLTEGDWEAVVGAAVHFGCALEFNIAAQLTDELLGLVVRHKALITIGSDAHRFDPFTDFQQRLVGPKANAELFVDTLERLSAVPKAQIVNTWEPAHITSWFEA
jgi:DNA polymerase (family 10)